MNYVNTIAILGAVLVVLLIFSPETTPPVVSTTVTRSFDPTYGVACYWREQQQPFCLQVAPTAADLDLEDAPAQEEIEATKYVF